MVQTEGTVIGREYLHFGSFGSLNSGDTGDYNKNGSVDAADYIVWRCTLGQMGAGLGADGDGDQAIDANDYFVWRANFGQTSSVGSYSNNSSSVPEPTSIAIIYVALLLSAWRRWGTGGSPCRSGRRCTHAVNRRRSTR